MSGFYAATAFRSSCTRLCLRPGEKLARVVKQIAHLGGHGFWSHPPGTGSNPATAKMSLLQNRYHVARWKGPLMLASLTVFIGSVVFSIVVVLALSEGAVKVVLLLKTLTVRGRLPT